MIIKLFVQNRSGIKVPRFRIYLQRIETFTTVDLSAKKSIDTKKSPINPMLYAPVRTPTTIILKKIEKLNRFVAAGKIPSYARFMGRRC
jgi:hypothetical protein